MGTLLLVAYVALILNPLHIALRIRGENNIHCSHYNPKIPLLELVYARS